jgi:hypothetical protein
VAAPLINPSVAFQGEMWTMLMQMIPSADAIGQTECDASNAMGAHIREVCGLYPSGHTQQGVRFRIGRLENESREMSRERRRCSPEPLAISRMTPIIGRTPRRTSRIKSPLRSAAGAYRRSSLIILTHAGNSGLG